MASAAGEQHDCSRGRRPVHLGFTSPQPRFRFCLVCATRAAVEAGPRLSGRAGQDYMRAVDLALVLAHPEKERLFFVLIVEPLVLMVTDRVLYR